MQSQTHKNDSSDARRKPVPTKGDGTDLDQATLERWYDLMYKARLVDDEAPNYLRRNLGWSYHAPCAGHDGIQLALGLSFRPKKDYLFPYYRDLLTCIAGGISLEEVFLNGMSKATDVASGGRHMSNHFAKPEIHIQNVSSVTGNHALHAAGLARAIKIYKDDALVFASMGESAPSEGFVYEAMVGISREKLPVILVLQDNGYGISVPKSDQTANVRTGDNFKGLPNIDFVYCDGKDPVDSWKAMQRAIAYVRSGKGGALVYADCVRIGSHSNSDNHILYRSKEELAAAKAADPLPRFRKILLDRGVTEARVAALEKSAEGEVQKAAQLAMEAPQPDPSTIHDYVLPPACEDMGPYPDGINPGGHGEALTLREAINASLRGEFRRNPDTYLWGQDIANGEKEGIFLVTKGMQKEFGKTRVFNAPIAEDFICGTANGFSRYGKHIRVVIEGAEFADYFWPAMEELLECSHDYWRTAGQFAPNVVIRLASGGYIGGGLYHSQNLEGTLATLPGIRIVYPSFADDAYGLMRTAMRSEGPTMFLEPKFLYNHPWTRCQVPEDFMVPFGKARVRRAGTDLSIITYGTTVHFALQAAQKLAAHGHSVEVVDLRSIYPLDEEAILATARKTGKVLIAHEDKVRGGFGGEIAAIISDRAFQSLDAPVRRIGATFTPVAFNRTLEKAILPNPEKIEAEALALLNF